MFIIKQQYVLVLLLSDYFALFAVNFLHASDYRYVIDLLNIFFTFGSVALCSSITRYVGWCV